MADGGSPTRPITAWHFADSLHQPYDHGIPETRGWLRLRPGHALRFRQAANRSVMDATALLLLEHFDSRESVSPARSGETLVGVVAATGAARTLVASWRQRPSSKLP